MKAAQSWPRLRLLVLTSLAILALLVPSVAVAAPAGVPVAASNASANQWGSGCSTWHTVRAGDNLSTIAQWYGVSMNSIMAANGITNPSRIFIGESLCIPGGSSGGNWDGGGSWGGNCSAIHWVTRGETLSGIARWYGVSMWDIMAANGMLNANQIFVGQRLCIPGSGGTGGPISPQPPADGCSVWHTVARGDTLTRIAAWYGTSVWAIMQANGLSNPNHIWVGQQLRIPSGCTQPQPPVWPPVDPCNCWPTPTPVPPPPPDPCPCPPVVPTPNPPVTTGPWFAEFFNNNSLSGGPVFTNNVNQVGFNWGTGGPGGGISGNTFSARFSRQDWLQAGTYRFYATSDDGIRVFVNDQLVIDGWRIQSPTTYFGDVSVGDGFQNIRVEYFNDGGGALLFVNYTRLN